MQCIPTCHHLEFEERRKLKRREPWYFTIYSHYFTLTFYVLSKLIGHDAILLPYILKERTFISKLHVNIAIKEDFLPYNSNIHI